MWTRQELKFRGKQAFQANYGSAVGVALIMGITTGALGTGGARANRTMNIQTNSGEYHFGFGGFRWFGHHDFDFGWGALAGLLSLVAIVFGLCILFFGILVGNVLEVGGKGFFVLNGSGRPGMGEMLRGFRSGHYGNLVITMFLRDLYVFLWTLLLIVPGVIKYYEYLMVPYILAENPGMDRREAFAISRQMMNGQKMEAFILDLSYLGWYLLSAFTCGLLAIFYVNPYKEAAFAELYIINKGNAYREGYIR